MRTTESPEDIISALFQSLEDQRKYAYLSQTAFLISGELSVVVLAGRLLPDACVVRDSYFDVSITVIFVIDNVYCLLYLAQDEVAVAIVALGRGVLACCVVNMTE